MVLKQRVAGKLRGAIFAMGGLKLARAFGWWRVLAAYLKHMKAAMMAIQDKVRGGAVTHLASSMAAMQDEVPGEGQ